MLVKLKAGFKLREGRAEVKSHMANTAVEPHKSVTKPKHAGIFKTSAFLTGPIEVKT